MKKLPGTVNKLGRLKIWIAYSSQNMRVCAWTCAGLKRWWQAAGHLCRLRDHCFAFAQLKQPEKEEGQLYARGDLCSPNLQIRCLPALLKAVIDCYSHTDACLCHNSAQALPSTEGTNHHRNGLWPGPGDPQKAQVPPRPLSSKLAGQYEAAIKPRTRGTLLWSALAFLCAFEKRC